MKSDTTCHRSSTLRHARLLVLSIAVGMVPNHTRLQHVDAALRPQDTDASDNLEATLGLLELVIQLDATAARKSLRLLTEKVVAGSPGKDRQRQLVEKLTPLLKPLVADSEHELHSEALTLAAGLEILNARAQLKQWISQPETPHAAQVQGLWLLASVNDPAAVKVARDCLERLGVGAGRFAAGTDASRQVSEVLDAVSRARSPEVASLLVQAYANLPADLRPRVVETLVQRPAWSRQLFLAIKDERIPAAAVNLNQVRQILASGDSQLRELVENHWGVVREGRSTQRTEVIEKMRSQLASTSGDPWIGQQTFHKVCGQCHKIYGEGYEVGPDLTANGRSSFEQLLSNVFDPSLVIGAAYQSRTVLTEDGRVITGLLVEDGPERVTLKLQGGKTERIPREQIEALRVSPLSLMPEGLENQLKPEEWADLFAFLTLDRPPHDPEARRISGTTGPQLIRKATR